MDPGCCWCWDPGLLLLCLFLPQLSHVTSATTTNFNKPCHFKISLPKCASNEEEEACMFAIHPIVSHRTVGVKREETTIYISFQL